MSPIAQFQIDSARQVFAQKDRGKPVAIVAGVSSGKTIAFMLPLIIQVIIRSLEGEGGKVRALVVYPRATLVEDQFQRLRAWCDKISLIGKKNPKYNLRLNGPALDAAGKLGKQLSEL